MVGILRSWGHALGIIEKTAAEKAQEAREAINTLEDNRTDLVIAKEQCVFGIRKLHEQIRQKQGKPLLAAAVRELRGKVTDLEIHMQDIDLQIRRINERIAALTQAMRKAA